MDSVRIARIRKSLYELGATLEELYALGRTLNLQTGYKLAVLTWDLDQGIAAVIDQIDEAEAVDLLDQLLEALKTLRSKPAAPPIAGPGRRPLPARTRGGRRAAAHGSGSGARPPGGHMPAS